ncbi:TPA: hypothetical protein R4328_002099 [Pasteurella multocida]|nr:hypothetical protein [Pasteurella multocida]
MTDQNQQTVMLTDVHGNEYHSNMRSVTAILEHKYAGEVLLAFGISSAIKIPKSLNELIEKCNLNETAELNKRDLDAIDKEIAFHEKKIHTLNEERREFINRNDLNKGKEE